VNEVAAFLEAIAENLDELGPRLRFADYLDESLDPALAARAEFIRVQCALDHLPESDPSFVNLARRERELLDANWRIWMRPICQALGEPLPVPKLQRSWGEWMRRRFRNVNQSHVQRLELFWGSGLRPTHMIAHLPPPQQNRFFRSARFARGFVTSAFLNARPSSNSTYLDRLFERTPISHLGLIGFDRSAIQYLVQKRWLRRLRKLNLAISASHILIDLIDAPDACFISSIELYGRRDEANSTLLLLSEANTLQPEEIGFRDFTMNGDDLRALADSPFMARSKRLKLDGVSFDESALVYLLEQTLIEHLELLGSTTAHTGPQISDRLRERFPRLKLSAERLSDVEIETLTCGYLVDFHRK
jgi:uncharacterized protein (TIGR02996 family)